jgi:uncharacterized protein YndB with AHSA1/START domain
MRHFSETIEIARPPQDVWRAIGTPERWFDGYLEIRARSADYPAPDTRDDHVYRTRRKEEVDARVTRSEAPRMLEEDHEGKTFSRHVCYSLRPSSGGDLNTSGRRRQFQRPRQVGRGDRHARHQAPLAHVA